MSTTQNQTVDESNVSDLTAVTMAIITSRALLVAIIFAAGFLFLGYTLSKAVIAATIVLLLHLSGIGQRRLDQAAFAVVMLGLATWLDLIPWTAIADLAQRLAVAACSLPPTVR